MTKKKTKSKESTSEDKKSTKESKKSSKKTKPKMKKVVVGDVLDEIDRFFDQSSNTRVTAVPNLEVKKLKKKIMAKSK